MEESEENLSADDIYDGESPTKRSKPKKRSMIERELETNLTARVTSPISIGDASSTSRYGRSRRLKNEVDTLETEKSKIHKLSKTDKSPKPSMQSPVYKMHASNSPVKMDSSKSEPHLDNQIENIYTENNSFSRFGSAEKKSTPLKKYPKVYIRKDLIQTKDKDKETEETVVLIKNMFSPVKSIQKMRANSADKSNEKYGSKRRLSKSIATSSVVKTLDFDEKNIKKDTDKKVTLSKNEMFELEAQSEYQVGDLAWARMGTYPFWPCIITREPLSGLFVKKKIFGRHERNILNVTFFGDNGRRSWIADSMLRPFLGQLEFEVSRSQFTPEAKKKDPKLYMAYFISKRKMPQWIVSVEEAEMLLKEPKRLRIDILSRMLMRVKTDKIIPKPEKSKRVTRTDSDVSLSESLYDTLFSEDDTKGCDADRSRNRSRNKSLDVSEVVTACLDNMAAKTGITKIQRQSHMDRWLLKAKTKTPEKSQSKSQVVPKTVSRIAKVKKLPNLTQKPYKFRNRHSESQDGKNLQKFTDEYGRSDASLSDNNVSLYKDSNEKVKGSEEHFESSLTEDLSSDDKLIDSKLDASVNDNNCLNSQSDSSGNIKNESCNINHKYSDAIETKNVLNRLKQSLDSQDSSDLLSPYADVSGMSMSLEISRIDAQTHDIEMVSKKIDMGNSFLEKTNDGIDQSSQVNEDSRKNKFNETKPITSSPKCDNKDAVPISSGKILNDETPENISIDVHYNEVDKNTNRQYIGITKLSNDQNNDDVKKYTDHINRNTAILDIPLNENVNCVSLEISNRERKKEEKVLTIDSEVEKSREQKKESIVLITQDLICVEGIDLNDSSCTDYAHIDKEKDSNEINKVLQEVSKDDSNFFTDKNYKKRNRTIDKPVHKNLLEPIAKKKKIKLQESFKAQKSYNHHRRITRSSNAHNYEENEIDKTSNAKSKEKILKNINISLSKYNVKNEFQNNKFRTKDEMSNFNESNNEMECKSKMIKLVDDYRKSNKYSCHESQCHDQTTSNINCESSIDNNNQLQNPVESGMVTENKLINSVINVSNTLVQKVIEGNQNEEANSCAEATSISLKNKQNQDTNGVSLLSPGKKMEFEGNSNISVVHHNQNDIRPETTLILENSSISLKSERNNINKNNNIKTSYINIDFQKYLELKQDSVMDEHPELSQDEISSYLFKTWLYEQSNKSDRKKVDQIDQTRLVKGTNYKANDKDRGRIKLKRKKPNDFNLARTILSPTSSTLTVVNGFVKDDDLDKVMINTVKQYLTEFNEPEKKIIDISNNYCVQNQTTPVFNNSQLRESLAHSRKREMPSPKILNVSTSSPEIDIVTLVTSGESVMSGYPLNTVQKRDGILDDKHTYVSNKNRFEKFAEDIKVNSFTKSTIDDKLQTGDEMTENMKAIDSNTKMFNNFAEHIDTKWNNFTITVSTQDDNLQKDDEKSQNSLASNKKKTLIICTDNVETKFNNIPETVAIDNDNLQKESEEDTQTNNKTETLIGCAEDIETKLNNSLENSAIDDRLQKDSEMSEDTQANNKTETLIGCAEDIETKLINSLENFAIEDDNLQKYSEMSEDTQANNNTETLIGCAEDIETKLNNSLENSAIDDHLQKDSEMSEDTQANNKTETLIGCAEDIETKLINSLENSAIEDDNLQKYSEMSEDTQANNKTETLIGCAEDIETKLNNSLENSAIEDDNLQKDSEMSEDTQANNKTESLIGCAEEIETKLNNSLGKCSTEHQNLEKDSEISEDTHTSNKTKSVIICTEDIETKLNNSSKTFATEDDNLQENRDVSENTQANHKTKVLKSFANDIKAELNNSTENIELEDENLQGDIEMSKVTQLNDINTNPHAELNNCNEMVLQEENNEEDGVTNSSKYIRRNSSKRIIEDKNIPDDPGFQKYLQFKQDSVIDEHPELSQEEIISYLYKTWLYEENIKSDKKKSDEVDQTSLVKGAKTANLDTQKTKRRLSRKKPGDFKDTKIQQTPTVINQFLLQNGFHNIQDCNKLLETQEVELEIIKSTTNSTKTLKSSQVETIESREIVTTIEDKHTGKQGEKDDLNVSKLFEKSDEPYLIKDVEISIEEPLKEDDNKNSSILSPETDPSLNKDHWKEKQKNKHDDVNISLQSLERTDTTCNIDDHEEEAYLSKDEIVKNDELLSDDSNIDSASITSADIEMSLSMRKQRWKKKQREKLDSLDVLAQSDKLEAYEQKASNEELVKKFDNFDSASITSTDSEMALSRRRQRWKEKQIHEDRKKVLEDSEFVRYLELRQDSVMDEHPELTEEEITDYLYKTWLYEENIKSDKKRVDEIDQTTLVKGMEPESHLKKLRKKLKVVKEDSQESFKLTEKFEVSPKEKSKRSSVRPYYNEEFSDTESEMSLFEIFRTKKKSNKPSTDVEDVEDIKPIVKEEIGSLPEADKIANAEEIVTDEIDLVEMYFQQLTTPKPNVFKGLNRERVCDICEKVGNLVKCKTCHCMFHVDCVRNLNKVPEEQTPKGRKKARKYRRKPKNSGETFVDSEGYSDERTQDSNSDLNASIEYEREPIVADAEDFETKASAKMKEILGDLDKIAYDYESSKVAIPWNITEPGKCQIVDVKLQAKRVEEAVDTSNFKCNNCEKFETPTCFVCKLPVSPKEKVEYRQKCHVAHCYKYYHLECLAHWPQTQFNAGDRFKKNKDCFEAMSCPRHVCHTCVSDDPRGCKTRFSGDKLARCVRCPATYHSFTKCLPAGSQILTGSQIICPRHFENRPGKVPYHVNTGWCFICALGGTLICCEYCPTSFHAECLNIDPPEGGYMCEDCETGRLPLYGEMVWVKLGHYRWWPGIILHPLQIPQNLLSVKHSLGEFVVRFFGQYDHYWVNRGRVFPFQEGDTGKISNQRSKIDAAFTMAVEHASRACEILKHAVHNDEEEQDIASSLLPPHYVKLKVNKPVGSLVGRRVDVGESSFTQCECDPADVEPCGAYSQCLNRMLLTECGPSCRAGDRCNNRAFEKRQYPKMEPYRTPQRGWGLRCLEPIRAGQFVIEYVGELLDEVEFQRRMRRAHEVRDENFYFLTLDKERMIDAGPKGNLARFMNHSCEPNCETQKWTVLGDVRVGLFAINDIPANSELTFNYNLESAGIEKKQCMCGAKRCSGYIGAKPKQGDPQPKKNKRTYKKRKNVETKPVVKKQKKIGRPVKPKELTEIEKDLLIIKSATHTSSDSEHSERVSEEVKGIEEARGVKRKRPPPAESLTMCIKRVKTESGDEFRID